MRLFRNPDLRSFYFLNATQFLGALNDNIFKLLIIYLLINLKGPSHANTILSLAGALFVIPFLLFSSGAGVLADRISKRTIIVFAKILEFLITLFGLAAVFFESEIGSYSALFFLASHSALFGPSKYGIIPELVESKMVSKANATMTSFTYLAIILGTFLASFIVDITNKNYVIEAGFCVFVALMGLIFSLGIHRTKAQNSPKKINPFFLYEIYQTVRASWKVPHLLLAMFGSSFFLFIGAYTQLNIIPFAMQSLNLSEVGGGYLFLATAVGIAIGAVCAGQLSKDEIEPGISCIAGILVSVFFVSLYLFSSSLIMTILNLAILGMAGGAFLIPFDSFIQVNSPEGKRGQVIAATNFFSFSGVLFAAFSLYFINEELELTAASGFGMMGLITLVINTIIFGRLSSFFLPFFAKKILKKFRKLLLKSNCPKSPTIVILKSNSWWDAVLLYNCFPRLKIFVAGKFFQHFPWINGFFDAILISPIEFEDRELELKWSHLIQKAYERNQSICLFIHKRSDADEIIQSYLKLFHQLQISYIFAHGKKEKIQKKALFFQYDQRQITIQFTKD